jgi:hypothetical protein
MGGFMPQKTVPLFDNARIYVSAHHLPNSRLAEQSERRHIVEMAAQNHND